MGVWRCRFEELVDGVPLCVAAGSTRVVVVRADNSVYAVAEHCTHADVSLCDGEVDGSTIECPRHGAVFDLTTGAALTLPATRALATYPVRVDGDEVVVDTQGARHG